MMHTMLLAAAILTAPAVQDADTDTTFAVPAGARLSLQGFAGEVVIRTWSRNEVRVQADHSSRVTIAVELQGSVLRLKPTSSRAFGVGAMSMVEYELTLPAAMPIEIEGMYADVDIEGTKADVKVQAVEGDLRVSGGEGSISLTTISGDIEVRGSRGRIDLHSTSDDILVEDVQGELVVEAVSGDVTLHRIDARRVDVQSVSGDLLYDGTIRPDGRYALTTHAGDVVFGVPEGTNATLRLAVGVGGGFSASFGTPAAEETSRRRRTLRLGSGSASIELETFSGDVRLVRPSEIPQRPDRED